MQTLPSELGVRVDNLVRLSRERHAFAFTRFDWPAALTADDWWLSPELLSIYDTPLYHELDESRLKQLAKWECINLFSLNVEGERELVARLTECLYRPDLPGVDDYLHHFIDEENQHMWFFAEFCRRYGHGGIYTSKKFGLADESYVPELDSFLLFARIFVFEEVGTYYNVVCSSDERLHPFIREINDVHRADESRHLAFGRVLLKHLAQDALAAAPPEQIAAATAHLNRYMQMTVESLYQPAMYRDAGLGSGLAIRRQLLAEPARRRFHQDVLLKRSIALLQEAGFAVEGLPC
jgi:hypothetical protein